MFFVFNEQHFVYLHLFLMFFLLLEVHFSDICSYLLVWLPELSSGENVPAVRTPLRIQQAGSTLTDPTNS